MIKSKFLPESCYEYVPLSFEHIVTAYVQNNAVTGKVCEILNEQEIVVVQLGDNIFAHMSYAESSIYPMHFSKTIQSNIPTNIYNLLNKVVQVKVISFNQQHITVSRRANMLVALEHIMNCDRATFLTLRTTQKFAFGDIGAGITGCIGLNEMSKCHIKSTWEVIRKGDTVEVCILGLAEDNYIKASYKKTFPQYNKNDYHIGMTITGKVGDFIGKAKKPGVYIHIAPQVSGIMNVKKEHPYFKYGAKVECYVTGIGDKGLHLAFSRFV